jgi:O-antigen ligase
MSSTAIVSPIRVPTARLLAWMLFVGSTLLVALTLNPMVIALWVGSWAVAIGFGTRTPAQAALLLALAIVMLYPEFSSVFMDIHEKVLVLAVVLMLAAFWCQPAWLRVLRHETALAVLVSAWIGWGLLAYLPVVAAWLWITVLAWGSGGFLGKLQHVTSGVKTAAPMIPSALVSLLAISALRERRDFRMFRRALELLVIVVAILSLAAWALGTHFVPYDPSRLDQSLPGASRLVGVSMPDANGFGRLLLFPTLLFMSAAVTAPRALDRRGWLALALAVGCIVLTQSRTTYISFTVGLAVLAALNLNRTRLWWFLGGALVWITVVVLATNLGNVFAAGSERLSTTNIESRAELWVGALQIIGESPWFGAHPSGYVEQMQKQGLLEDVVNSAHNLYLAVGVEWGVPMVLVGLGAMSVSIRCGWRAARLARRVRPLQEARIFGAAVVATTVTYGVHGLGEIVPPLFIFLTLGCAVAARRHAEVPLSVEQVR